jgi:starch synthase
MVSDRMNIHVLFIASEADPFVKVGGLGDVAGSLLLAIRQLDPGSILPGQEISIDIRLSIPFHGIIRQNYPGAIRIATYAIPHISGSIPVELFYLEHQGLPVYLISGPPIPPEASVYSDDLGFDSHKYVFFSLAALEMGRVLNWPFQIIHANDWHTAATVYALALNRQTDPMLKQTLSILGIHNLPYLGVGSSTALSAFGLPPSYEFHLPAWAQHMALPLGLLTADQIIAVSPTYAREILTPEFGAGLHGFLQTRKDSISGILNGLDTTRWDPAADESLIAPFDVNHLERRAKNKKALQLEFDLSAEPRRPLIAMITRMDYQKGIDLALGAIRQILKSTSSEHGLQFILLGTGLTELEQTAAQLENDFPQHVKAALRFDPRMSRRIYAGADMLLMPSRYEPCGLAQMIAMRYGCVPIARATGGLRDTILDASIGDEATGFLFSEASVEALQAAIERALAAYQDHERWTQLQIMGMHQDFSWQRSALEYARLYIKLLHQSSNPNN